jgi:uncharacterized iron-regulated membrane protein
MKNEVASNKKQFEKRRIHNVFFNTHTVSGIVISVGLYIIFLAGAFALFQNTINNWEINEPEKHFSPLLDYERIIDEVEKKGYQLYGRDVRVSYYENNGRYLSVFAGPPANKLSVDSLKTLSKQDSLSYAKSTSYFRYNIDPNTYELTKPDEANGPQQRIGHLLTRLHYFHQIPLVGRHLSGFVSIFFLFAIVTGVIVHWNKIISNFFTFRLKASIKNLWTDAHTALGVLGIPFQFMYAVTGVFFGLGIVLFPVETFVKGDTDPPSYQILFPAMKTYGLAGETDKKIRITPLVEEAFASIPEEELEGFQIWIKSFGDINAHLTTVAQTNNNKDFAGKATSTYKLIDGTLVNSESQYESSYATSSMEYFTQLHYGNFGGLMVQGIYFVLAVITCFVIITGVMVWLTAREKKMYAHKAKFNRNVGAIYLGACLGLYPAIALLFITAKVLPFEMTNRFEIINYVFFGFWLAYTVYAFFIKDNFKINKYSMLLAGVLGLAIPFVNGAITGLWFWKSNSMGYPDSFLIDVSWLVLGVATLLITFIIKPAGKIKSVEEIKGSKSASGIKKKTSVRPARLKEEPVLNIKPTQN